MSYASIVPLISDLYQLCMYIMNRPPYPAIGSLVPTLLKRDSQLCEYKSPRLPIYIALVCYLFLTVLTVLSLKFIL